MQNKYYFTFPPEIPVDPELVIEDIIIYNFSDIKLYFKISITNLATTTL